MVPIGVIELDRAGIRFNSGLHRYRDKAVLRGDAVREAGSEVDRE
jgi:hypothetical protein